MNEQESIVQQYGFMSINRKDLQIVATAAAVATVQGDASSSPASSSRSYRRIKELKNSTNSKKSNNNNNNNSSVALDLNDEDCLKKNLIASFTKRRERKGSLPEIDPSRVTTVDDDNDDDEEEDDDEEDNLLLVGHHPLTSTQETFADTTTDCRRVSRKSAFVLEVARTSMFRSKSLTDLNCSLVKADNNNYGTLNMNTTNASSQNTQNTCALRTSYKNLNSAGENGRFVHSIKEK